MNLSASTPDLFEGHHRGLREIIDALSSAAQAHDQTLTPQSQQALKDGLDRLSHFSSLHFAEEEKFMDDIAYPDRKAHGSEHNTFLSQLKSLDRRLAAPDTTPWAPTAADLSTWWENHARDYDRLLADFLCRGGI